MQQKKRKKWDTRTVASLCLLIALLLTLAGASLAWLVNIMAPAPKEDFYASSIAAYFAGGDGSSGDPYLITEPVHLYNLAWLQYLGIFNEVDAEGNILHQYYFRVENDIVMNGLVLPPIGTSEQPFVGNFDGNNKMITGAIVSNYLSATESDGGIVQAPASVTSYDNTVKIGEITQNSASIVGFFGVVGNWDNSIKGLAVESADSAISERVNAVYNFFLKDLTVRSDTAESLMGLLAGYVSGTMSNVGIGDSRLELGDDVNALNMAGLEMQQLVSQYSLIGYYDGDMVNWVDKPTGSGDGPGSGSGSGGDGGDLEGGGDGGDVEGGGSDDGDDTGGGSGGGSDGDSAGGEIFIDPDNINLGTDLGAAAFPGFEIVTDRQGNITKIEYQAVGGTIPGTAFYVAQLDRTTKGGGNTVSIWDMRSGSPVRFTASTLEDTSVWEKYSALNKNTVYIKPAAAPNFTTTVNAEYTQKVNGEEVTKEIEIPTNGVWFKPQQYGTASLAFAKSNNSDNCYMGVYRFQRTVDAETGEVSFTNVTETVFILPKEVSNGDLVYYEYEITEADAKKYEYMIGKSSQGNASQAASFVMMELAGTSLENGEGGGDNTPGDGAGWGGSVNMKELLQRATYILGSCTTNTMSSGMGVISSPYIDLAGVLSADKDKVLYLTSSKLCYFADGTCMPLNVDTDTMFDGDDGIADNNNAPTTPYYQGNEHTVWRCATCGTEYIGQNYSASSTCTGLSGAAHDAQTLYKAEKVDAQSNTGYLVGGGSVSSTSDVYIRSRPYYLTQGNVSIYRAFGLTEYAFSGGGLSYTTNNKKSFQMLTVNVDGETYVINDGNNTINQSVFNASSGTTQRYTDADVTFNGVATVADLGLVKYFEQNSAGKEIGVKSKLDAILDGQNLFHSAHFMAKISLTDVLQKKESAVMSTTANILGKTLQNYEMIKGAINFTVSKPGYITAVAATNYKTNTTHSLFTLFSIKRDTNNEIESVEKISTIYEKTTVNDKDKVVERIYLYNLTEVPENDKYTTYKLVYNEAKQNKLVESNAVYYFEIPVAAGEYAVGGLSTVEGGADDGAYLMYLDIGANGNAVGGDQEDDLEPDDPNQGPGGGGGSEVEPIHIMSGINFVDEALLKSENRDISTYPTVTLSVTVNNATHAPITVAYGRVSTASMTYQIGGGGAGSCAVSSLISEGVTVSTSTSLISAQLWALPPPTKEEYGAFA